MIEHHKLDNVNLDRCPGLFLTSLTRLPQRPTAFYEQRHEDIGLDRVIFVKPLLLLDIVVDKPAVEFRPGAWAAGSDVQASARLRSSSM